MGREDNKVVALWISDPSYSPESDTFEFTLEAADGQRTVVTLMRDAAERVAALVLGQDRFV